MLFNVHFDLVFDMLSLAKVLGLARMPFHAMTFSNNRLLVL